MSSVPLNAPGPTPWSGVRHVTILCAELVGLAEWNRPRGDLEAARIGARLLALLEIIVTREDAGQVLQAGGDSLLAVFNTASAALSRALEIQRVLDTPLPAGDAPPRPQFRLGLHMGEILLQEGERLELLSRHTQRARALLQAAAPGQILASEAVVEAARDFIGIPPEFLAIQYHGPYYLKNAGATELCEVADRRFRTPAPPARSGIPPAEGSLLGRLELAGYRNLVRLREGSLGVVYRAEEGGTGRTVAIQVLHPWLAQPEGARAKYQLEQTRLSRAEIPDLPPVLANHLDHSPPFLVTDWVEGQPLSQALAGASAARIAKVFGRICSSLERAHRAGAVHGGLTPENVLVRPDGAVTLLDFGLAAFCETQAAEAGLGSGSGGTPPCLAPEVIRGAPRDARTDLYLLGLLLFQVLTGRGPFQRASLHELLQDHLHSDPPWPAGFNPAVPDGLQRICLKALEKNPPDRYQSAGELGEDLERFRRGDRVRTRPTAYDNLLLHRVRQHVGQVRDWAARGLLNEEEQNGLLSAYEGLQRRGLPAVMESRLQRFWQTLVYLSGWTVINGALIWLLTHYADLSRTSRLLLGSIPAVTAFGLAAGMWRAERYRLTFVALVVGILAAPLLTGVWLHEFKVASHIPPPELRNELFAHQDTAQPGPQGVTNRQLLFTFLSALAVALGVMTFTRTTTHSAQALLALVLTYSCGLACWFGLKPLCADGKWAVLAARYLPLLVVTVAVAGFLLQARDRDYQAAPWVFFSALLLMGLLYALSLRALEDWTHLDPKTKQPAGYLLLSASGLFQTALGLWARRHLRHRCRMATLAVVLVGLLNVLAGLALAGWKETWPGHWWRPILFATPVPIAHLALPITALLITLLASRVQMLSFLLVGLAGFAASIHLLGWMYFEHTTAWPKCMIGIGALSFFIALFLELRRSRGHAADDVAGQLRL